MAMAAPTLRIQTALPSPPTSSSSPASRPPMSPGWRRDAPAHEFIRKQMMVELQRLHPVLATRSSVLHRGHVTCIPQLVQRLELMLYKSAYSLDEYQNVHTLKRRVNALVTHVDPAPLPKKRRLDDCNCSAAHMPPRKRILVPRHEQHVAVAVAAPSLSLTLHENTDLVGQVAAFLDGREVLRLCGVNRFFAQHAPTMVFSLSIDVGLPAHAGLRGHVASLLQRCRNLQSLTIRNSNNALRQGLTWIAVDTDPAHRQPEQCSTAVPSFSAQELLLEAEHALTSSSAPMCTALASLSIQAAFPTASESCSVLPFLRALALHWHARGLATSPLRRLELDTLLLGDRRIAKLCTLFARTETQAPSLGAALEHLALRHNFIGAAGMHALCSLMAQQSWPHLQTLALCGNILTDVDARRIAAMLRVQALPNLASLDLRDNFLTSRGIAALQCYATPKSC